MRKIKTMNPCHLSTTEMMNTPSPGLPAAALVRVTIAALPPLHKR
jgi:hypothetical protein